MLKTLAALIALFFIVAAVACSSGDDNGNGGSPPDAGDTPVPADGGGGNDSDGPDDGGDDSDDDRQPVDSGGSSGSGVGFIEAGGQRFDVSEVRRCQPFFEGDDNLDLQALASDGVILFVVINTPTGSAEQLISHELSIQGGGLGVFSNSGNSIQNGPWLDDSDAELTGPPFQVAGDRVQGMLQLNDSRGSGDTLDVSFDVPIPSEIIEC